MMMTLLYLSNLDHLDHKEEAEGEGDEHQQHGAECDEASEVAGHLALALALLLEPISQQLCLTNLLIC